MGRLEDMYHLGTSASNEVHLLICSWLSEYQDWEQQNLGALSLPGLPSWHLDQLEAAEDLCGPKCVMEYLLRAIKNQKSSV